MNSKEDGTVISTKHGTCQVKPTGLKTAIVRFEAFTLRGVTYKGHIRLNDYGHGLDAERENPENENSVWHALYATRTDKFLEEPTKAAKQAMRTALIMVGKVFQAEHPGAFILAHAENLRGAINGCEEKVETLTAELASAEEALADARHAHETFCKLHNL